MRPNGIVRMDRREELTLLAASALEAVAYAWLAGTTARDLFKAQPDGGPVDLSRFRFLSRWLRDDLDEAMAAFRRADDVLRRHILTEDGAAELADPLRLEFALTAARLLKLDEKFQDLFLRQIAASKGLAMVDEHGVDWLLRFFALIGHKGGQALEIPGRARMASAEQVRILRAMFEAEEGMPDPEDRCITDWIATRYGISALRFLDSVTAWKAIVYLRGRLANKADVAA